MGAGVLYHLAKGGWSDVVLVEKAELTSGSTWHAAGHCAHFVPDYSSAKLFDYGIRLYQTLEVETGQSVGWHGCGSLKLANSEVELDWLKYAQGIAQCLGNPMEIIGPAEISRILPHLNIEGVLAAALTTDDGYIDPASVCNALAAGARKFGAEIVRQTRVVDLKQRPCGEWEVITEAGTIVAEHVVNAAGCYARQVGAWVGLDLPIANITAQYIVTDPVDEFAQADAEIPIVRDSYFNGYFRQEQKSGLIGVHPKRNANVIWQDGAPWEAEHELFSADLDAIAPMLERVMKRMPIFAELGIKRSINGAIPFTPDGNLLLGPAPGFRNLWLACGASTGIAQGGGAGNYLSQWVIHGEAELNMQGFDPRRFGRYADQEFAIAKSSENYCYLFDVHLPGENLPAGRPLRKSAVHDRLHAEGAIFGETFGWERPKWFAPKTMERQDVVGLRRVAWFEQVGIECRAVREAVGVADLSGVAKFDVFGADAEAFLNRVLANGVPRRDGGIVLAHMLGESGMIEAEVTATRLAEGRYYLTSSAAAELRDFDWLRQHRLPNEDVQIEIVTEEYGCLAVAGPSSRSVLTEIAEAGFDDESFSWLTGRDLVVEGVPSRVLRLSATGELGWELHVPTQRMASVYDAVKRVGRKHGIADVGFHALNSLRMEKAYPGWGSELTNDVTPVEANIERFVKFDKGDFTGRQALLARAQDKPEIRLVYLEVDASDADPIGAEAVFNKGEIVGMTTSGAYGYAVEKSLAFAYVNVGLSIPGQALELGLLAERRPARVLGEAAYDPRNTRPRG
jgi:dimethylglycine dehydrogenase